VSARGFASDNHSGVHPEVLEAIAAANEGHAPAYGADRWTAAAADTLRRHFGEFTRAYPVFNGSGANVVSLAATTRPWHAVICPAGAHMNVDEAGAPERIAGVKLLPVECPDGKLTPALLESGVEWHRVGDEHAAQPRLVSISNSTELGTVYRAEEVAAIAAFAHERGLLLHVDGSRLSNAAASLGTSLGAISTEAGADIVSFGGTKNGLLAGEAVVFASEELAGDAVFARKQSLQLASKMRFISCQLEALLREDLWLRNATAANAAAERLAAALTAIDGVELAHPAQANGVFARLPTAAIEQLEHDEDGTRAFYVWDAPSRTARLMCSWDTSDADVEAFAARLAAVAAAG
jgi:threonine aldolase